MAAFDKIQEDPTDIRNWQIALAEARCRGKHLFVRNSPDHPWFRVDLVQSPNCVVWISRENSIHVGDTTSYEFDPAVTTFSPFLLDGIGEIRFGDTAVDFRNS